MSEGFSLGQAIAAGGPVMYILILCSVLSLGVIFDRLYCYSIRSRLSREHFMRIIRDHLSHGDVSKAEEVCRQSLSPFAAVVAAGLRSARLSKEEMDAALEGEMILQTAILERRISFVGSIGSTAVYIGLLGTVWGIIKAFQDIATTGSGGMNVVTAGIAEALVCTGAGLLVAIPAVLAYNYFVRRIHRFVTDMELCALEITGLVKRARHTS